MVCVCIWCVFIFIRRLEFYLILNYTFTMISEIAEDKNYVRIKQINFSTITFIAIVVVVNIFMEYESFLIPKYFVRNTKKRQKNFIV